ncbi:acyclic terpene utilization AtuA family protein [Brevibacterium luteolum]|uniref:acyclic terpene utilization AtuA family protein n=1 Tax=Brevibacterium luteolum TaxID=199591 RepID=UPI00223ACC3B|nr:acyclic terpene utilization AtuA family protein [Brevibacterium luteolum]MCT1658288.1 DUF1446 domain-containing protein [Brevibacterium luteolum]
MSEPITIANCSGFYGDRLSAAREMVEGGHIDVLTGDWLAELTMLILAKAKQRDASKGYASTFIAQMEDVLATCFEKGIRIISNAGGLNPRACAEKVAEIGKAQGISPRIAYLEGDDLLPKWEKISRNEGSIEYLQGSEVKPNAKVISANAYLGGWGVAKALHEGADVVITGRTTDAALVSGPAAWWHGWNREDWDQLAGAVAAGHVIECGTQATGGNYSFFTEIAEMKHIGFPIAQIHSDGSSVITKHPGTGGQVSIGTVTSQLMYEVGSPKYLGPDVDSRFDTLELEEVGPDCVRISGTKGLAPSGKLKVSINTLGGYRNDIKIAICGLDVKEKADLLTETYWDYSPYQPEDYDEAILQVVRTDHEDAHSNEAATALWHLTLKDPDQQKVDRRASNAAVEMALSTTPGFYLLGGSPPVARSFGVHAAALVDASHCPQTVQFVDGQSFDVELPIADQSRNEHCSHDETVTAPSQFQGVPVVNVPLGRIFGARSGDKGGDANLGVFGRTEEAWAWLDAHLTVGRLSELLPEVGEHEIERYRFPNIRAVNFVIRGLLGDGVAASVRQDAQAKSLGEWLRSRIVGLPQSVLDSEQP